MPIRTPEEILYITAIFLSQTLDSFLQSILFGLYYNFQDNKLTS